MTPLATLRGVRVRAGRLLQLALQPARRAERRRRIAYEELFRNVEGGTMRVAAAEFGGAFEIDCRSHILKRALVEGAYETAVAEAVRRHLDPDRDAIDVGANIGLFTVLMSGLLTGRRRVLAVEPAPRACGLLRRNIAANGRNNVLLFQGVAAERPGRFTLHVVEGREEYSSLTKLVHPSIAGAESCRTPVDGDTLDRLAERWGLQPGIVKIDAEGAECRVLAGCRRTLDRYRPVVVCEEWPEELLAAAGLPPSGTAAMLRGHGYAITRRDGAIFAIPEERV